jgi:hypothetical protein
MFRRGVTAWVAGAAWHLLAASSASASHLPTIFSGDRCVDSCERLVPVYSVRPHTVTCQEELGGELTLKWSHWTATKAVGSGTSMELFMGHEFRYHVRVVASAPVGGHFTRLHLEFSGSRPSETLRPLRNNGVPYIWGSEP